MDFKLRISPVAQGDIESIYEYVKKDGESIAKNQINIIYDTLSDLELFPKIGKKLSDFITSDTDYMYIVINKIYYAFYILEDKTIEVVRILRCEQDYIKELELK